MFALGLHAGDPVCYSLRKTRNIAIKGIGDFTYAY